MDIKMNTVHFDADKKLVDFVNNKVKKLTSYCDNIIGAEVFLTFDKSAKKHTENKAVKIKIDIPKADIFADKQAKTFEEAIDSVVDALKKQLMKHKEKIRK